MFADQIVKTNSSKVMTGMVSITAEKQWFFLVSLSHVNLKF
eukprot:UN19966